MAEVSTKYRYHPESSDTMTVCKQFEEKFPNAQFNHSYIRDGLTGTMLLRIEAWDESREQYYAQVLRDSQEPEDIVARFYESLKPQNLRPRLWLPS